MVYRYSYIQAAVNQYVYLMVYRYSYIQAAVNQYV